MKRSLVSATLILFTILSPLSVIAATTPGLTYTSQSGLANTTTYTPQVTLEYGENNSFGGLSFKGVGSALVACSGLGDLVAGAVTGAISAVKSAIGNAVSDIPYVGGFLGGLFGVGEPGSSPDSPSYVKDDALENKAACLDGIAYVLSQQVLQQITNRTLHWANTGFNGNPLYVKDIDSYLLSIRNQNINTFLQGAQGSDPIFGNALRSVVTQQVTGISDGLANTSLKTPQAAAYDSFMGDFTNGGWEALLNPANNPIGAFFNTTDSLNQKIGSSQQNTQNELLRNNGFLDMKTCVQYSNPSPTGNTNTAIANGLSTDPICLKYETVTPGSIIGQQVSTITNSPVQQAQLATHFNEAVGSFFDSLLNQLFSRGLSGVKGIASSNDIGLSYGGPGSNVVLGADGQAISGINDNVGNINDIASGRNAIDISHPQLLRAIIQTQYNYINRAKDSRLILDRHIPELGQLDYCYPGPNPTWQNGLSGNVNVLVNGVITPPSVGGIGLSWPVIILASPVPFTDKLSGTVSVNTRSITGGDGIPLFKEKLNTADQRSYLKNIYNDVATGFNKTFDPGAIANAYVAATAGTSQQAYAAYTRGMSNNIYNEISTLPGIFKTVITQDKTYGQRITTTQEDLQELEAINAQVIKIVSTAKARYVAQQKAAGTPVNTQCLDASYTIDTSAVTGVTRQESDAQNPIVQQSLDANTYFYNSIK